MTHVWDPGTPTEKVLTTRSVNAFAHSGLSGGKWYFYLAFSNGDPTATCSSANDVAFGYPSGSKFLVAHEYQHVITNCSFKDGAGNPGLSSLDWLGAVHEGLSDVFGGLFSETWIPGPEFSYSGLVFRNIVFPRDPNSWTNRKGGIPCGRLNHNNDHFADKNDVSGDNGTKYDRGTILAHCAYLLGQGGVHQRATRNPVLIPVYSLGTTLYGGLNLLKAARIWYRALTYYFSTHGALTGIPTNDENTFRTLRDGCEKAAIDIYGKDSIEHKTTILAFYAVGLHPTTTSYGADVTFLRWGADWRMSRPYIGIPSPDWSSMDLFINNGGTSEWNAKINVLDTTGKPTTFENKVYCRVRNIGDQSALNVKVDFFYAKVSTGVTTWLPMKDKSGTIQRLNIGTLAAGQSNFPDSAQNSPPAIASVKWHIPPLAAGETVNHFCMKAKVTCSNDVNSNNNEVQSNISYIPYTLASGFSMEFNAGNPTNKKIPLELQVDTSLPKGWNAHIKETTSQIALEPGEEKTFHIVINMVKGADQRLELPLDGEIKGQVSGSLSGSITGSMSQTILKGTHLRGLLSAHISDMGILTGTFDGHLDTSIGHIRGIVDGTVQSAVNRSKEFVNIDLEGCIRPFRRVDIRQLVNGEPIGGITIQVQVPILSGPCVQELPSTDTFVKNT